MYLHDKLNKIFFLVEGEHTPQSSGDTPALCSESILVRFWRPYCMAGIKLTLVAYKCLMSYSIDSASIFKI